MSLSEPESRSLLEAFLKQFGEDQKSRCVGSLEDYLSRFPGDGNAIGREYFRLLDSEAMKAQVADADSVGPYKIERELGRGGQGSVYLAEDTRLHRKVALKILSGLGPGSEETVKRFKREAEIASKLEHPGICGVHDAGIASGVPYIAMQLVPGETLAQRIAEAKADPDPEGEFTLFRGSEGSASSTDAEKRESVADPRSTSTRIEKSEVVRILEIFEKLARALHAAHGVGIIHRDIKPANIMVTPEGQPVILDFGLARDEEGDLQTLTRTGDLFGTPAYMSPEQLMAQRIRLDRRTDVYSLGATLYECLTLHRPFEAPTREALYQAILTNDPSDAGRLNPAIPRDLRVVLDATLEKNRDRRYQTALDLALDLGRVRDREPISARPIGPVGRALRWAQRNPALAVAACAITLGLLATSYLWLQSATLRKRADKSLAAYERMSDEFRLEQLVEQARDDLWPAGPGMVKPMEAWLENAYRIAPLLSTLVTDRDRLRSTGTRKPDGSADAPAWEFENPGDGWRHDRLAAFTDALEVFTSNNKHGETIDAMKARLGFARIIERRTLIDHELRWQKTIGAIEKSNKYPELKLKPQIGLIPLGPDPKSGYFEFLHWLSHAPGEPLPVRNAGGMFELKAEMGILLVLLPGGAFQMGAAVSANMDPLVDPDEKPVHVVKLDAFFMGKYEVTQAQWRRFTGAVPAYHNPDKRPRRITWTHPVESVAWDGAGRFCERQDLFLPTEAQWEYACRAGTKTAFFSGKALSPLVANIRDEAFARHFTNPGEYERGFDDTHAYHAPVGSLAPNPFGLFDMHGNVNEWCLDELIPYQVDNAEPGTGLRIGQGSYRHDEWVARGGDWRSAAKYARSANRLSRKPEAVHRELGFRASARVHRD